MNHQNTACPILNSVYLIGVGRIGDKEENMQTWYFNDLIDSAFKTALYGNNRYTSATDPGLIKNGKEQATLSLAVPGLTKEDIELEVKEEGVLELKFLKQNDFFRSKERSWSLSEDIDIDSVTAECKDGMLTITLPKLKPLPPSKRKVLIS